MDDDGLGAAAQPHCEACGVVMSDEPGAYVCPSCGARESVPDVAMPPGFDGPAIHGG